MNRQHVVLWLGMLLVLVNTITSGSLAYLWGSVTSTQTQYQVPQPNPGQTLTIPGTNGGTIYNRPGYGDIIGMGQNYTTPGNLQGPHPPGVPVSIP